MVPHLVLAAAGVWLMAAPAVVGYADPAATSDRIAGPVLAAVGFLSAFAITRLLRWLNLLVGLWLLAVPWLSGFPADASVNSALIGALAVGLAPWGAVPERYGGGWMTVVRGGQGTSGGSEATGQHPRQ